MKITIDENVCHNHKLTLEEFLVALLYRQVKDPIGTLDNLLKREVLTFQQGQYFVTQHWSEVLDEILCDSAGGTDNEEHLLALAQKMRECYPQGKMKDRYGRPTPYYYRCNNSEVVKKLKKFFLIFGNYSDEDILSATRRYVASFQGNYSGMRLIKYFILKDDVRQGEDGNHVEQISDLASFLENKEGEGEEVVTNDDSWLITSRN